MIKKALYYLLIISISFVSVLFIFAFISPFINPSASWIFPFSALIFKYLFFVYIFLLLLLFYVKKNIAVFFTFIIIPSVFVMSYFYKVSFNNTKETSIGTRLLSYNVHNLCNNNYKYDAPNIKNKIFDFLIKENADYMFLQDFSLNKTKIDSSIKYISSKFKDKHIAFANYFKKNKSLDGLVILSKTPIIRTKALYLNKLLFAIASDILIKKDTFRLYNIHINSFKITNIKDTNTNKMNLVFDKMKHAYMCRAIQINYLKHDFSKSPYNIIVAGDFNDIPLSYTYRCLIKDKKDAFREKGNGFSNTYIGKYPSFRIDYILVDKRIKVLSYIRCDIKLSDHFPIIANISF